MAAMPVFVRYLLYQLPGTAAAALGLVALHLWLGLPGPIALALLGLWIAHELVLYPFVKGAYDDRESGMVGAAKLLDARGVAHDDLDPHGYVCVRGELWRAQLSDEATAIRAGDRGVVRSVSRLTLLVGPEPRDTDEA
jgi:membrane protein implicated in regulation of membrane protease activity